MLKSMLAIYQPNPINPILIQSDNPPSKPKKNKAYLGSESAIVTNLNLFVNLSISYHLPF